MSPTKTESVIDPVELDRETTILEDRLANLREAGLFWNGKGATNGDAERAIDRAVYRSRRAAEKQDLVRAAAYLSRAAARLENAVYGKGWYWRTIRLHHRHILLYHIVALVVILNIATGWGPFGAIADSVWSIPMAAFGFGALGGTLRGLYWLQVQVNRGVYRDRFDAAHLAAPWVSGLFGGLVYLLLKAGLLTLTGEGGGNADNTTGTYALVFFAGFSWEWIVEQLGRIGSRQGAPANAAGKTSPEEQRAAEQQDAKKTDAPAPGQPAPRASERTDAAPSAQRAPAPQERSARGSDGRPPEPDSEPRDGGGGRSMWMLAGGILLGLRLARARRR